MRPEDLRPERFQHALLLDADLQVVRRAVCTAVGLQQWFIGEAVYQSSDGQRAPEAFAQTGDRFTWIWLQKDHRLEGQVLLAEEDRLRVTFGEPFAVSFRWLPEGQRIRLELIQDRIGEGPAWDFGYLNCCVCWTFFLTNLKSVLEHGTDLREVESRDEMLVNH